LRDLNMLNNENISLKEQNNNVKNELDIIKEKEMKMMKILYVLNKKGIQIEEILENELIISPDNQSSYHSTIDHKRNYNNNDDSLDQTQEIDESALFLPITLEPPKVFLKPKMIPNLNLTNINSMHNENYGSPIKKNNIEKSIIINNMDKKITTPTNNKHELKLYETYININKTNKTNHIKNINKTVIKNPYYNDSGIVNILNKFYLEFSTK
jgi:hypothetical protein